MDQVCICGSNHSSLGAKIEKRICKLEQTSAQMFDDNNTLSRLFFICRSLIHFVGQRISCHFRFPTLPYIHLVNVNNSIRVNVFVSAVCATEMYPID